MSFIFLNPILLIIPGIILSIFSFGVCLYVAYTLGKRLKRESLLAEIISTYCEIREFNSRCKNCLQRLRLSPYYQLLGTLPSDLQKVYFDTNQVFLEAFSSSDFNTLLQTKAALSAISSRILQIMTCIEIRLRKVKYP